MSDARRRNHNDGQPLLTTLERTSGRYGLLTICEGGGQANVTIIERI